MKNFLQKICLTAIVLCFSVVGFAYDFEVDGIYYNINGDGASVYVTYYYGYSGDIIISSDVTHNGTTYRVTSIDYKAFYGCSRLTSVTIPNSVTSIGDFAFDGCTGLTSVTIPNSVTSIGGYAFSDCSGLTSVQFNAENCSDLTGMCHWLSGCENITSFTFGENVKTIPSYLCYGLSKLNHVTIPNSVTTIGYNAFSGCSGLTSVTIPNSVTYIGDDAFSYCSGLTSVQFNAENCSGLSESYHWLRGCENITSFTFGENVKTIPSYLCYGLSKLNYVTIPNSVTTIGRYAFSGCSGLTSVTIPNSVTSIGFYAFNYCRGLTSVTIGNSVTSIGDYAFLDCTNLQKSAYPEVIPNPFSYGIAISYPVDAYMDKDGVIYDYMKSKVYFAPINLKEYTIPTSVSSIGSYAFAWCSDMQSVDISSSVNYIGFKGFYQCNTLSSIQCDAATPPSLSTGVFDGVDKENCSLIVPDGSIEAYKAADQWKDFLKIGDAEEISIEDSNISVENGMIINRNNEIIEVYGLSGAKVYTGSDAEVSLKGGMYIVKVGGKVVKIAI